VFSILPDVRNMVKERFPGAHPANLISVKYDIKSDFEKQIGKLENHLYPALLGVESKSDLDGLYEIQFVDPQTDNILHKIARREQEV
jgi:hypothetical protein